MTSSSEPINPDEPQVDDGSALEPWPPADDDTPVTVEKAGSAPVDPEPVDPPAEVSPAADKAGSPGPAEVHSHGAGTTGGPSAASSGGPGTGTTGGPSSATTGGPSSATSGGTWTDKVRDFFTGNDDDRPSEPQRRAEPQRPPRPAYRRGPDGNWVAVEPEPEPETEPEPKAETEAAAEMVPESSLETGPSSESATEPEKEREPEREASDPSSMKPVGFEPYTIGEPGRAFTNTVAGPPEAEGFFHDLAADAVTIHDPAGEPRLVLRAASVRGLMHQQYADPRQDDHAYAVSRDRRQVILALADGVSSGKWSHHAAQIATAEGVAFLTQLLDTSGPESIDWQDVLREMADRISRRCAELNPEDAVEPEVHEVARQMATTVVYAVISTEPAADGTHAVTVVRHGDTSAWLLDQEHGWTALGDVKNAGNVIAESATTCLPFVPDQLPDPEPTTVGTGQALVLMTDGIGDPLGSGKGEVGARLQELWARPPHIVDFTAQVSFGRRTYDDDRGAIVVWPIG